MMEIYGKVQYISSRGLGWEGEVQLYTDGDRLYVDSMSGEKIPVQWVEEGKSVSPIEG